MNTTQLRYLEKGYGAFPYFIIRITSGLYKQIPIHFKQSELSSKEGVFVAIDEGSSFEEVESRCLNTLVKILDGDTDLISSGDFNLRGNLTGCLVLEPERAVYLGLNREVTEGSIPWGGTLVSMNNEFLKFPLSNHYFLG